MSKSVKWLSDGLLEENVEASRKMYDFIERDFGTCIEYVALDTKHFGVYSPRLANITLRIGPEILRVFNLLLFDQKFSRFFEKHPKLEEQLVKIQKDRENRKDRFIDYLRALPNLTTDSVEVKAVKIGNSLRMTIPKPIVDYLKISEGDTLEVTVQDSEMAVKKK